MFAHDVIKFQLLVYDMQVQLMCKCYVVRVNSQQPFTHVRTIITETVNFHIQTI